MSFAITYTVMSTVRKYGQDPNAPKEEEEEDPFAGLLDSDDEDDGPPIYEMRDVPAMLRKTFFPVPSDYTAPPEIGPITREEAEAEAGSKKRR